ncbi:hypothetical protein [Nostoc sp.]
MQYLKTFWTTVVNKKLYRVRLKQQLEQLEQLELRQQRQMEQLEQLELRQQRQMEQLEQRQLRQQWQQHMEQMEQLRQIHLEREQLELELKQMELERIDRSPNLKAPNSSVEIRQKSHIKGWLSKIILEEWRGELEALRCGWLTEEKPELWIKIMTGFHLLALLKAYIQIKLEDRWLFKRKQT